MSGYFIDNKREILGESQYLLNVYYTIILDRDQYHQIFKYFEICITDRGWRDKYLTLSTFCDITFKYEGYH